MIPADRSAPFFRKGWVRVQNGSGEEIPPHAVMRISSGDIVDGEMVIVVGKPDTADLGKKHLVNGPFLIGIDPTDEGYATFLTDGGPVMVSGSPSTGDEWGPVDGQWHIATGGSGFHIIGGSGTSAGNSIILAQQDKSEGSFEFHRGVTDGAITKGTSGTVSRYTEGTTSDSGTNDTVQNEIANIGSGKVIYYVKSGSNYYAITGECPLT